MALDPTSRESNIQDSVKKYFVDNIYTGEGVHVVFDRDFLEAPNVQGTKVTKWVTVNFAPLDLDFMSTQGLKLFCCTRGDPEGYQLSHLRDKVVGYLVDSTQTDGLRRIPLYRTLSQPWTQIGSMVAFVDPDSGRMQAPDGTKFKIIPVRLKWAAKI